MTYRARIKNGVAVLEDGAVLPEGAEVIVQTTPPAADRSIADRFADVIGTCPDLPEDMARNHDHYPHGKPKR